jgi:hypothetical protein
MLTNDYWEVSDWYRYGISTKYQVIYHLFSVHFESFPLQIAYMKEAIVNNNMSCCHSRVALVLVGFRLFTFVIWI